MPMLIAGRHQDIPAIINAINGHHLGPHRWPGDRFDLARVPDGDGKGGWTFSQVPQLLLPGDSPNPVPEASQPPARQLEAGSAPQRARIPYSNVSLKVAPVVSPVTR